jgi:hypothetical protein
MTIHVYAMWTRLRSWDSCGEVFTSREARTASLRAFCEEIDDNVPEDADEDALVEICSNHDHEIDLFDNEIEIEPEGAQS